MNDASVQADSSLDSLVARVADEFRERQKRGERPRVEEYTAQHPEAAVLLRNVLAALDVLGLSHSVGDAATALAEAPVSGEVGDFRIVREIGRGGMGVVYEAEQVSLHRRVALKVLPLAGMLDPRHLQRFRNEAQAAACLHHGNIVPVYAVGQDRGIHFYAMQLIEGVTLAAALHDLRQPDHAAPGATTAPAARLSTAKPGGDAVYFRKVAELGVQAAEALDYAHQLGVVHRDVKPANLMLNARGTLWVTDFGLAHFQQGEAGLTMTGDLVGTLRYMSPEQALAKRVLVDHRTDVYSLGATLYELLTLRPVFGGEDRQELLRQIAFEDATPPRRINKAVPPELETVVLKALEKNPAERYATAQELADDLRRWLEDQPIRAKRPSLRQRGGRWARRHKPLVGSIATLVVMVLVLGGSVLGWRQRQLAITDQAVGEDLREADLLQKQERWSEELQVLERASGRLAVGGSPVLRERVAQRRKDIAMVARLEEARLHGNAAGPIGFDDVGDDRAYAAAFASYGLDLETLTPAEAAERIRTSPIRTQLVAALDDWAFSKQLQRAGSEESVRALAQLADDDPWRRQLRDPEVRTDRAALERLAEAEDILAQPPGNLQLLSHALDAVKGPAAAVQLLRRAQQRHPADFWINFALAFCLWEQPATKAEAIGFWRVALALRPHSPLVYRNLGTTLSVQRKLAEAEAAYRKAIDLKPDYADAYCGLGYALAEQYGLGQVLYDPKKLAEAEAAYRKAVELKPDYAAAYYNLGNALRDQKKGTEAEAAWRKAIECKPDHGQAHNNLGQALLGHKKFPEAEAALRKASELQPDNVLAHYNLGIALAGQKKLPEAETAFRKAIELKPNFAEAYCNLGHALRDQGEFADALVALKRGHELGSQNPGWRYPSAQWVRVAERLVELDAKLPKVLKGEVEPTDVAERLALAELCELPCKSLNAAAVRFYADAFAAQPQPADDLQRQPRYNAACAAALAGCRLGKDAEHLDSQESARLRKLALDWLRADLTTWRNLLEKDKDKTAAVVAQTMQHWLGDTDFNGVRGAEALAKLPEAERGDWQRLWDEVAALRQQAQPKEK